MVERVERELEERREFDYSFKLVYELVEQDPRPQRLLHPSTRNAGGDTLTRCGNPRRVLVLCSGSCVLGIVFRARDKKRAGKMCFRHRGT